jgi:hypothetical protein
LLVDIGFGFIISNSPPPCTPPPEFLGCRRSKTENPMTFDIAAGASAPAHSPIQFVNIEITPLIGGRFSVVMQATLLDEEELEFIGQDLASAHVDSLDEALAVIRTNVVSLNPPLLSAAT